jgi:hypothetical protein
VVVRERSEWFGDEKVLPPPIVVLLRVSAFDLFELRVSGFVATVGAADFVLLAGARCGPELASSTDVKLFVDRGVAGLEKERASLPAGPLKLPAGPLKLPDCGYGLFFATPFFDLDSAAPWFFFASVLGAESEVELEDLRFARRFIHPVKGRLRVCRSLAITVSKFPRRMCVKRVKKTPSNHKGVCEAVGRLDPGDVE